MRILLILFISMITFGLQWGYAQGEWTQQTWGENTFFSDVYFSDMNNGWAVGATNTIVHTNDGGETWEQQEVTPTSNYAGVFFIDDQTGWACGSHGKIDGTTDGGETWTVQESNNYGGIGGIYFINADTGWAACGVAEGFNNDPIREVIYTTDGGENWNSQYYGYNERPLGAVDFYDADHGMVVGSFGGVMYTSDGGNTWQTKDYSEITHLEDVYMPGPETAIVIGQQGLILKTTDGGDTWAELPSGTSLTLTNLSFVDPNTGWVVGGDNDGELILHTTDGGESWTEQSSPVDKYLSGVHFVNEYYGWAVGFDGTIIHYSNAQMHEYGLGTGYDLVSSNLQPQGSDDMTVILEDLMNNESLDFVRDSDGNMLQKIGPEWVNNIGEWETIEGYLFKMNADDMFTIEGAPANPQMPIPVGAGYQFISYLPQAPMDALEAMDNVLDNLDFMRDSEGNSLQKVGPNWVNNIGDMEPGEGYLVRMNNDDELIYPE
ncbi:MAG: hypothetical protein K9I94_00510 [Bacteroidales bacterium]|nr:hypothetical protein [Bacteroidales bacterium]